MAAFDPAQFHMMHEDGTIFQIRILDQNGDVIRVDEAATRQAFNQYALERANAA